MSHYTFDFILFVSSDQYDRHTAELIAKILRDDGYFIATPWIVTTSTWGKNMSEILDMQIDQSERCIPLLSPKFLAEADTRYRYTVFESRPEAMNSSLVLPFKLEACNAGSLEILHHPIELIGKDLTDFQMREWLLDILCWPLIGRNPHSATTPRPQRGGLPTRTGIAALVPVVGSSPNGLIAFPSVSPIIHWCPLCGAKLTRDTARFCTHCGSLTAPSPTSMPLGAALPMQSASLTGMLDSQGLLHQRYRIIAPIGQGGMGAVYKAEDMPLQRPVAIKEMSQTGLSTTQLQEVLYAFRHEALILSALMHPNLPRVYEQFQEQGRHYLVMDFIEGETLEAYLKQMNGQPLPPEQALEIGNQLCTVLDYLHTRQPPIIFRDLKPANIMRVANGHLYLIDFGIARHFKPGQAKDTVAWGSSGYAAPEQYGREQTTAHSDIYSLGAVLHQLLSGNDPSITPFRFAPLHLSSQSPLSELEALVLRMVAMEKDKRPNSVADVLRQLRSVTQRIAQLGQSNSSTLLHRQTASSSPPLLSPMLSKAYHVLLIHDRADQKLAEELEKWLVGLGRSTSVPIFVHHGIDDLTGTKSLLWRQRIQSAHLVLPLLSADLTANGELFARMEEIRREAEGRFLPILPILLRSCMWEYDPFTSMYVGVKSIPQGKPLTRFRNRDEGWQEIFDGLSQVYLMLH